MTETVGLDYRESCLEWLTGCSNTIDGHPEDCKECTTAFREHIERLSDYEKSEAMKSEMKITLRVHCNPDETVLINNLYKGHNSVSVSIGNVQFVTSIQDVFTEDLLSGIVGAIFVIEGYRRKEEL